MEPKVNYLVVGLFVIGLTAALIATIIWFTASAHKPHQTYLVYMGEAATGLMPEAAVRFNGVDVGYVKDIQLNRANPQQVVLTLSIEEGTPINQSTSATLMVQGITGVTYIGLTASAINAAPLAIRPGEQYPVIPYKPSLLVQLNNVLRDVGEGIKGLKNAFKQLLNEENQKNISQSLANMTQITNALAKNSQQLDQLVQETANTLLQTKTVMKMTAQQTLPSLNQSLSRLGNVLNNMEQLSSELKDNPSMLIRGKAPTTPGPGER